MTEIEFYNNAADGVVIAEVFFDANRRGIQLVALGQPFTMLADAWLDEGECVATAEETLRDLLRLRQGTP